MYLVLLETSGNQNFIFSTNKLKENIGASELTYRAGTKWVLEAIGSVTGSQRLTIWKDSERLRKTLLDKSLNPPIDEASDTKVEVIMAASGKALLLTKNKEDAQAIIRQVTQQALEKAPGLDICGAIQEFEWDDPKETQSLAKAIKKIYKKFETIHARIPSPNLRFLRLPIINECSTSGLPAAQLVPTPENEFIPLSNVSFAKQECSQASLERMAAILREDKRKFARNINELEKKFESLKWLAVVHADGNGLGQIFLNFDKYVQDNRKYVDQVRRFSIALDICTENAFLEALKTFSPQEDFIPLVPLVLGGDDLTVVCDGKLALDFTEKFLTAFERETARSDLEGGIIPKIAKSPLGVGRLSACAGIAIVKPHFPFSVAYKLAEDLIKSAKTVKTQVTNTQTNSPFPCSALDFHILYDSSGVDFKEIRNKLKLDETTQLHNRPYLVTPLADLQAANGQKWAEFHHWLKLKNRVNLLKDEAGHRLLPTSQMYNLRTGLFLGKAGADAQYKLIRDRYPNLQQFEGKSPSLFEKEPVSNTYVTDFLDALDALDFLNVKE